MKFKCDVLAIKNIYDCTNVYSGVMPNLVTVIWVWGKTRLYIIFKYNSLASQLVFCETDTKNIDNIDYNQYSK